MSNLRFLTSGESHGRAIAGVLEGIPAGLPISSKDINKELQRRQRGYGRGGRMKIESDAVQILSGVRWGKTLGSPITLLIENRDWDNWKSTMSALKKHEDPSQYVTRPRPGHADLPGALKYGHRDVRNVLERSSARETAARVAIGAITRKFLSEFDINVMSYVVEIGGAAVKNIQYGVEGADMRTLLSAFSKAEASPVRCPDKKTEKRMIDKIDVAIKEGDSLGGIFEIIATGVPAGLGSYSQWDRRLNARLAHAVMGIQAIKGVEIGLGFGMSCRSGSEVMDEIFYRKKSKGTGKETAGGFYRKTNNAGGIEGGVSNGMPVVIRAVMKPIPTLRNPLVSVDIKSKKTFKAAYERSDVCAVPAVSVIGEAVTAMVLADCFLEKFGGDSMGEIKRNYNGYLKQMREF
jgi:chorismate synthase